MQLASKRVDEEKKESSPEENAYDLQMKQDAPKKRSLSSRS
jgi:hypothetical protein